MRRIRAWRAPPGWGPADWWEEVAAEAAIAALLAVTDFDPYRGVPLGCYVRMRVLGHALARYRREWLYGTRCSSHRADRERADPPDTSVPGAGEEMVQALESLPEADRWLIRRLFWDGRSQAEVAEEMGISQQAVSKRKRRVLKHLAAFFPAG
jgi:RNA polymerase sigma factor (sigma-70 family)